MEVRKILPTWDSMSNIETRRNYIVVAESENSLISTDKACRRNKRRNALIIIHLWKPVEDTSTAI